MPFVTKTKLIALFTVFSGFYLWASQCNGAEPTIFRVMTWNIHYGEGLDGRVDLERIAALVKKEQIDIAALQEVDKGVQRTKGRDLPAELAALTGMSVVFSNNYDFQGGEYGNAILTGFKVVSSDNLHYRKVNEPEQRGLLKAVLEVKGRRLVFFNTHLDHRSPDAARWSNVGEIEAAMQGLEAMPVILCADFNTQPESRVCERLRKSFSDAWSLVEKTAGFTIPAEKPTRRIDYIWTRKDCGIVIKRAWVPETSASDHRPVVAEVELGPR